MCAGVIRGLHAISVTLLALTYYMHYAHDYLSCPSLFVTSGINATFGMAAACTRETALVTPVRLRKLSRWLLLCPAQTWSSDNHVVRDCTILCGVLPTRCTCNVQRQERGKYAVLQRDCNGALDAAVNCRDTRHGCRTHGIRI